MKKCCGGRRRQLNQSWATSRSTRNPTIGSSTKANNCCEEELRSREEEERDLKPAADRGTGAREKVARSARLRTPQSPNVSLADTGGYKVMQMHSRRCRAKTNFRTFYFHESSQEDFLDPTL